MRAVLQKCLSALWFVFFQGAKYSPDFGGGGEWRNLHEIFFILEKKKSWTAIGPDLFYWGFPPLLSQLNPAVIFLFLSDMAS